MNNISSNKKSYLKFFILVYSLAIPFWVIGFVAEQFSIEFPFNLPISALMFVVPIIAALILVYRRDKLDGVRKLLRECFDYKRVKKKIWFLPSIFLMPILMVLSYWVILLIGLPLPNPNIPFLTFPILFVIYFFAAVCEEAGWMGYAIDPMLDRWSALKSSFILGSVGALLHVIPFMQAHRTLNWILWQCFFTIFLRVIFVWLYQNTNKSLLPVILFHTMYNVSYSLFPNNGSHYDPAILGLLTFIVAVIVSLLWGSKTLAHLQIPSFKPN